MVNLNICCEDLIFKILDYINSMSAGVPLYYLIVILERQKCKVNYRLGEKKVFLIHFMYARNLLYNAIFVNLFPFDIEKFSSHYS